VIRGGIDTGGTFTDVAVQRDGELVVAKVPTTPDDPSQAGADGLATALDGGARVAILAHGTTIATNALLQDALPPTALVTTRGFGDVVDIGRQKRLGLYDLDPRKPRVGSSCPSASTRRHGRRAARRGRSGRSATRSPRRSSTTACAPSPSGSCTATATPSTSRRSSAGWPSASATRSWSAARRPCCRSSASTSASARRRSTPR
jgi:Hydantoinase/oxoprolinase N-terminal region